MNCLAQRDEVLAEAPDLVILATGGLPAPGDFPGAELCLSLWDVLDMPSMAAGDIVIHDGTGRHAAPLTAVHLASLGDKVRFVAHDPWIAPEMEPHARIIYRKEFAERAIPVWTEYELTEVAAGGAGRRASFRHRLTGQVLELDARAVAVDFGTMPMNDLFAELRPHSSNDGVTAIEAMTGPLGFSPRPAAGFELHRIGDAVTSRSVHAAMLDALRLCARF